jgi:Tfp pilus assembly protein PilN
LRPVNLLPPRFRPARASGQRPGIGYAAIGVLAVLLLMVLLYVVTNNGINDAKDKTAVAQAEQQVAQIKIGQLQAYGDFATLKASREAAVAGVAQVRFDFERLMREVALVLPKNTYLTTFTASGTAPSVNIAGCAPSYPGVATAIVRLRKLHNVQSVDLASSTKNGSGAASAAVACKVAWNATMTFAGETPPTTQKSVPARLGGGQ